MNIEVLMVFIVILSLVGFVPALSHLLVNFFTRKMPEEMKSLAIAARAVSLIGLIGFELYFANYVIALGDNVKNFTELGYGSEIALLSLVGMVIVVAAAILHGAVYMLVGAASRGEGFVRASLSPFVDALRDMKIIAIVAGVAIVTLALVTVLSNIYLGVFLTIVFAALSFRFAALRA